MCMKCKKWTKEKIQVEALKYKSRVEFSIKSNGAYKAALKLKIIDEVCVHMLNFRRKPWTNEELFLEAFKYNTRSEFQKGSSGAYDAAQRLGILEEICQHMTILRQEWSLELLKKEALKYDNRSDFAKNSPDAYQSAWKRKLLDTICSHMPEHIDMSGLNHPNYYWTDEMLALEALKYFTRLEFMKNNNGAYQTALKRKILDKICSHMKRSCGTSAAEEELFNILKNYIPCLVKKNFKVSVPGKPFIKRFQVDMLDTKTKLGIEYDGKYHHSEEYIVENKTEIGWPLEDAMNYHEIKDSALLNCHQVSILHIKEVDWNKDKQACIDKCLAFLGVQISKVAWTKKTRKKLPSVLAIAQ
jgi:hypothetical protein